LTAKERKKLKVCEKHNKRSPIANICVAEESRRIASRSASATPRKGRPRLNLEADSDLEDKSYGRSGLDKVGSGRGGFSVKGAAAAAARARWAKVRKEREERGDESDEGERVKRTKLPGKKDSRAAAETFESGSNCLKSDC